MVAVDPKQQAELGRQLADAVGYLVRTAEGDRLGHVDHVRYRGHADHPDLIAVRSRWLWRRLLLVSFETVAAVDERARMITLRLAPERETEVNKRSAVLSRRRLLPRELEVTMFKRGKSGAGGARGGRFAALLAALAGTIGGLAFWRKRKTG